MKTFGKFAMVTSVLAFLLVMFITGPANNEAKQTIDKRGVFESFGAEFSGKAAAERQTINKMADFNQHVLTGSIILFVVGVGAWMAGSSD